MKKKISFGFLATFEEKTAIVLPAFTCPSVDLKIIDKLFFI